MEPARTDRLSFALGIAITATAIMAWRAPDAVRKPSFWAEDATVFWAQQEMSGPGALFQPFAGYFHLAPRMVAMLADLFPAEHAPLIFSASALGLIFLLYLAIATMEAPLVRWLPCVLAVTPATGEILFPLVNVQWHLAAILPLMAFAGPSPGWRGKLQLVMLTLASFSGPFALIAAPLYGFAYLRERRIEARFIIVALGAMLAVASLVFFPPDRGAHGLFLDVNALHSFGQTFGVLAHGENKGFTPAGVLALAIVTFAALRGGREVIVPIAFGAFVIIAANISHRGSNAFSEFSGARYFYLFNAFTVFALLSLALSNWRWAPLGMLSVALVVFGAPRDMFRWPSFPQQEWAIAAHDFEARRPAFVNVNPGFTMLGFVDGSRYRLAAPHDEGFDLSTVAHQLRPLEQSAVVTGSFVVGRETCALLMQVSRDVTVENGALRWSVTDEAGETLSSGRYLLAGIGDWHTIRFPFAPGSVGTVTLKLWTDPAGANAVSAPILQDGSLPLGQSLCIRDY